MPHNDCRFSRGREHARPDTLQYTAGHDNIITIVRSALPQANASQCSFLPGSSRQQLPSNGFELNVSNKPESVPCAPSPVSN